MVLIEAAPKALPEQRSRWPFFVCLALLAPVVAYVLVFKVPEWRNDETLARLEERVNMLPLPPDTEPGDKAVQGTVGIQSGNSNRIKAGRVQGRHRGVLRRISRTRVRPALPLAWC
jgi:hypothetical protein